MKRLAQLAAGGVVAGLGLFVAAYLLVFHTPLKTQLGLGGKCPFAVGQSTAEREAHLRAEDAALRGTLASSRQPALGFNFAQTTRTEVDAWLQRVGGQCSEAPALGALECKIADAGELPGSFVRGPATMFFTFGTQRELRTIQLMVNIADAGTAATALTDVKTRLEQDLGTPAVVTGETAPSFLAGGALRQTLAEFRFADYYASARVTNMGSLGYFLVSETYRSLQP